MSGNISMALSKLRQQLQSIDQEVNNLLAYVQKSPPGMLKTFDIAEAGLVSGKIRRAKDQLTDIEAEAATNSQEAKSRLVVVYNILNSCYVFISSEFGEYNREVWRFQQESIRNDIWQRYEADVQRTHEKFMIVASGIVEIIRRIPVIL